MPVISMASPKGGAGKTTVTLQLAAELARSGAQVIVIDADPNQPFKAWERMSRENGVMPENVEVREGLEEDKLTDVIDEAAEEAPFVLVDLEGSANMGVTHAIGRSDLVIVPIKGSRLDADQAQRSVGVVRQTERVFKRRIPLSILITQTSAAIRGKTLTSIVTAIREADVPVFDTELIQREAFVTVFDVGGTVYTLGELEEPVLGAKQLQAAQANTAALAEEVIAVLKQAAAREDAA